MCRSSLGMAPGAQRAWSAGTLRIEAVLLVAFAIGLVAFLLLRDGGGDRETPRPASVAVSASELREVPRSVGHAVYWVGPRPGHVYELTRSRPSNVFVRYLPPGAEVGDPRPDFLAVGSYPRRNAIGDLRQVARRPGSTLRRLGGGGIAVQSERSPKSVYVAYPGSGVQVEVYDPSPERARRLALSDRLRPLP